MNITREVVTDLLPIYVSGEASADTKVLVEEYFRQDPDFERVSRGAATPFEILRADASPAAGADEEKRGLERVRKALRRRTALFALSLYLTLVPLSFHFTGGRIGSFMVRDAPLEAAGFWIMATIFWFRYFVHARRRAA